MLSDLENDRLVKRSAQTPRDRATNDMRARRKLATWLKDIIDAELIIEHLPEDQTRDVFDDQDIYSLLYMAERLIEIKKFCPVVGSVENPEEWRAVIDENNTRPVENLDIWRSKLLGDSLNRLDRFYGANRENPVWYVSSLERIARMGMNDRIKKEEMAGIRKVKQVSSEMVSQARDEMIKARNSILSTK